MRNKSRWMLGGLAVAGMLLGCQARSPAPDTVAAGPAGVPAPAGIVVIREYVDPQKIDGVDAYFRIRYVWDYDQGSAFYQRWSLSGELLESTAQPGLTLETSDAELNYAFQLVREDPEFAAVVARPDAVFQGGFSVRGAEFPPCGDGSRCVRVFVQAGPGAEIPLVNVIVDLAERRIVARDGRLQAMAEKQGASGS